MRYTKVTSDQPINASSATKFYRSQVKLENLENIGCFEGTLEQRLNYLTGRRTWRCNNFVEETPSSIISTVTSLSYRPSKHSRGLANLLPAFFFRSAALSSLVVVEFFAKFGGMPGHLIPLIILAFGVVAAAAGLLFAWHTRRCFASVVALVFNLGALALLLLFCVSGLLIGFR